MLSAMMSAFATLTAKPTISLMTEPRVHPGECCGGCSDAGFDNLTVTYLDGSVPAGSCMKEGAGC